MTLTRAWFKYAQRSVEKNQDTLRAEYLASKLDKGDVKTFWGEVKLINTWSIPLSNKVGEPSGGKNIAGIWKGNYSNVLNYVTNICHKAEVEDYISSEVDVESEIVEAIKYLPHNQSPVHDSLMSKHFQYAAHRLPVLLTVLFKMMQQHGYLPDSVMLAMLVAILKSKTGDIISTGNYHPIAL